MEKRVKVELPYYPFIKYVRFNELLNAVRGNFLEEALKEMKKTGQNSALVRCPCCGRIVRITIEDIETKANR